MEHNIEDSNYRYPSYNCFNSSYDDSFNSEVLSNSFEMDSSINSNKHPFETPPSDSNSLKRRTERLRKPRYSKLLYSSDEEEELDETLKNYYDKNLTEILQNSFEQKNFAFNVRGAKLPPPEVLFTEAKWPDENMLQLRNIKTTLNSVKEKLNEYDLNTWHKHTKSMNPADRVMKYLKKDVKVEFLTQAWCKFYELVYKYKLIPADAREENLLFSVHLCEAPGAFVASLNHYIKLNYPDLEWYWKANTLNPYYEGNHLSEMINDDRFMLQTIDKWDFGPDMTGDITHPGYPDYWLQKSDGVAPHLVTADGSFDCQDKPEEQESSVSWLHLKEILNALSILRKRGNFVIKMFTFFECDTVCLLNLLTVAFHEVIVDKPATSKEGNSEVYVICKKYNGRNSIEPVLSRLLEVDLETFKNFSMFPLNSCNRIFYREITKCAQQFADTQIAVIERNIRLFPIRNDHDLKKHCDFLQEKFVHNYIKRYKLRPLKFKDNIVKLTKFKYQIERAVSQVIERRDRKQGTHAERVKRSSLGANDLLEKIKEELQDELCNNLQSYLVLPSGINLPIDVFDINVGKPVTIINSSQFCHGRFMRIRNEMIKVYGINKYNIATIELNYNQKVEDERFFYNCSSSYLNVNYNDAQRESFRVLFYKLSQLVNGDSMTLVGFPMLTQFNVNLMQVLRQCFNEIIFHCPECPAILYLCGLDARKRDMWMDNLKEVYDIYTPDRAVISFLPVNYVTGSNNSFYRWLVDANNCRMYYEILRVIDFRPRT